MSIIRAPRPATHFTTLRNDVLRDQRLSFRASGILADILSRPDNWRSDAESLARSRPAGEGRGAVQTALRELSSAGYIATEKKQDPDTGRWSTVSTVYDEPRKATDEDFLNRKIRNKRTSPDTKNPGAGKPGAGNPTAGKPGAIRSTDTKNSEEELTPPTPTPEPAPTAPVETETRGGNPREGNPNHQTTQGTPPGENTAAVAEACRLQPSWTPQAAATALRQAIADGHPEALARRALVALADGTYGPTTTGPRRLTAPGPWWTPGELFVPAPRPSAAPTCRRHRGQPAGNCAPCRSEQLADADEDTAAGPALTAASAREAARTHLLARRRCSV